MAAMRNGAEDASGPVDNRAADDLQLIETTLDDVFWEIIAFLDNKSVERLARTSKTLRHRIHSGLYDRRLMEYIYYHFGLKIVISSEGVTHLPLGVEDCTGGWSDNNLFNPRTLHARPVPERFFNAWLFPAESGWTPISKISNDVCFGNIVLDYLDDAMEGDACRGNAALFLSLIPEITNVEVRFAYSKQSWSDVWTEFKSLLPELLARKNTKAFFWLEEESDDADDHQDRALHIASCMLQAASYFRKLMLGASERYKRVKRLTVSTGESWVIHSDGIDAIVINSS